MEQLINQFKNLVYFVTLHPGSNEELIIRLVLGLLAGAGILNLMAQFFRMSFPCFSAAFFVLLVSGFLLFLLASFGHMYFRKVAIFSGVDGVKFTLGVFAFFSLLIVVPLIRSTWCGNFFNASVSYVVAVSVFLLTCVAIGEVFQITDTGKELASRQKKKALTYEQVVQGEINFDKK